MLVLCLTIILLQSISGQICYCFLLNACFTSDHQIVAVKEDNCIGLKKIQAKHFESLSCYPIELVTKKFSDVKVDWKYENIFETKKK